MDPIPYEPSKLRENRRPGWRAFWRRVCIASLCITGILFLAGRALATVAYGSRETAWFLVVDGLLALGELSSLTLAGVSGIGWAIGRRPLPNEQPTVSQDEHVGRFQFSLRALFVLTAIVAVYFSIASTVGYLEASGTAVALVLMVSALRWHPAGALLHVRFLMTAVAVALLWLVAVDVSRFREECEDCWLDRDIWQIRVYGVPLREKSCEYGVLHRVAEDLGVPCPHLRSSRVHLQRIWGLIYPRPSNVGIIRLVGDEDDDWYDEAAARIVRAKVDSSPTFLDEFHQRVFVDHDRQYIRTFFMELRQSRTGNTDQPQRPPSADQPGG